MWKPRKSGPSEPWMLAGLGDGAGPDFLPIPLQSLRVDRVTGFDLYWLNPVAQRHILYRQGGLAFTEEHRAKLLDSGVGRLWIARAERGSYLQYLEANLEAIAESDDLPLLESGTLVYSVAMTAVSEIFEQPVVGRAVQRVEGVVRGTLSHLLRGPASLATLMELMSADYHLYTHAVNVCVLGLALGHRLGLTEEQILELGAGLLLHDIGKTRLDPRLLEKTDSLSTDEEDLVRTHPLLGAQILGEDGRVASATLAVVLQHHEKCTGRGYPRGLTAEGIHPFAKIAALVNTFDSLTTHRPYRRAFLTYPAIRLMQEIRGHDFDAGLFQELIRMLAADEAGRTAPGRPRSHGGPRRRPDSGSQGNAAA